MAAAAGADVSQRKCRVLLSCSLLSNLFFLSYYHLYHFPKEGIALGWSRGAASQAEAVGAISCSGHGSAFLDGVPVGGEGCPPRCECHACYAGHDCSELLPDCPADADGL
ncbi:hypothetical protein Taro_030261 [Colocasia esculenta]|uniref:Alliinase EGF-like domain-containing protein n=1 Tax=Colocasia esculenta TaxID=4460 RepID=A0A843VM13_COLES|nr:hypothetical protein [Colocasia esculenta]